MTIGKHTMNRGLTIQKLYSMVYCEDRFSHRRVYKKGNECFAYKKLHCNVVRIVRAWVASEKFHHHPTFHNIILILMPLSLHSNTFQGDLPLFLRCGAGDGRQ